LRADEALISGIYVGFQFSIQETIPNKSAGTFLVRPGDYLVHCQIHLVVAPARYSTCRVNESLFRRRACALGTGVATQARNRTPEEIVS
jgi:hypothetical protein